MKFKSKFQDEDFELGEVVDAKITTRDRLQFKCKPKGGGEYTLFYGSLKELCRDWEDVKCQG